MVYIKLNASFRVSVDDCKRALVSLITKYRAFIESLIKGIGSFLKRPLLISDRLEAYEKKFYIFLEYFDTQSEDMAKIMQPIVREHRTVKLFVYRMNVWMCYKNETVLLLGRSCYDNDSIFIEQAPEHDLNAMLETSLIHEEMLSALTTLAGSYFDNSENFIQIFQDQTCFYSDDEFAELKKQNDDFIDYFISNINEIAKKTNEFYQKYNHINLRFTLFMFKVIADKESPRPEGPPTLIFEKSENK